MHAISFLDRTDGATRVWALGPAVRTRGSVTEL